MNNSVPSTILVIIGVTGDLSRRKLIPALINIKKSNFFSSINIIGTTRRDDLNKKDILRDIKESEKIESELEIFSLNTENKQHYDKLFEKIENEKCKLGQNTQVIFYLSVPPDITSNIVEMLGQSKFGKMKEIKILLEKPFGSNYKSAEILINKINQYFNPEQIYRIDHYLVKEMVQNIIVFRERNSLFRNTWNNKFIERIEISAMESIGIENRVDFYEQTGALRDIVQSHLLQLVAIALLDIGNGEQNELRVRRTKALSQLRVKLKEDGQPKVTRGQYQSYKFETNNPNSSVETFVTLELESTDLRWQDVSIVLNTGKKMDSKKTEIRIFYRKEFETESNELILHVQPNEGVEIVVWSKIPGYQKSVQKKSVNMQYNNDDVIYEAYEQVLLDAIFSDHNLFISDQEVLESWRIISPIQENWENNNSDLIIYNNGSDIIKILE